MEIVQHNTVIRKVRKTQHENPEFGHTRVTFFLKPAKKYISIKGRGETQKTINFGGKLSFILSVLFTERLQSQLHIFSLLLPIITPQPCALNAEFQHFILRFNKNFLTLRIPLKEGIGGEKRPKDRVKSLWYLLLQTPNPVTYYLQALLHPKHTVQAIFTAVTNLILITPTAFLLVKEIIKWYL